MGGKIEEEGVFLSAKNKTGVGSSSSPDGDLFGYDKDLFYHPSHNSGICYAMSDCQLKDVPRHHKSGWYDKLENDANRNFCESSLSRRDLVMLVEKNRELLLSAKKRARVPKKIFAENDESVVSKKMQSINEEELL